MARYICPAPSQYQIVTFNFEDLFPPGHPTFELLALIRKLDLTPFDDGYTNDGPYGGRPALPADRMLALIVYFLLYGNLSMRQLDRDLAQRADLMFLSAGLHVDHSTLGKFRLRHAEAIQKVFAQSVFLGVEAGLINLDTVCIDSTKIKASANRSDIDTCEGFQKRLKHVTEACQLRFAEWEAEDDPEAQKIVKKKIDRLESVKSKIADGLDFLNSHPWKKRVHLTDQDADWHKDGTGMLVGYSAQVAVDEASGMIVHAEVVTGQADSVYTEALVNAVESVKTALMPNNQVETKYVLDCGYASEANLEKLKGRDIYMPDREFARHATGGKTQPADRAEKIVDEAVAKIEAQEFQYNAKRDEYTCPTGRTATYRRDKELSGKTYREYRAQGCGTCPMQATCAGSKKNAKSVWVQAEKLALAKVKLVAPVGGKRVVAENTNPLTLAMRSKLQTVDGKSIYALRFASIEGTFGVIKNARQAWRFLRRTLERVKVNWAEHCLAHNFGKLLGFRQNMPHAGALF